MSIVLIDHYDSFSFNVVDWLACGHGAAADVDVRRIACDDHCALVELVANPVPLVLSPGPKRPEDSPATLAILQKLLGRVPILGICLGHQMLAHAAGAAIVRSKSAFHGSTREIRPTGARSALLAEADGPFRAATYNSLVVDPATLPLPWQVVAVCDQGEVQALAWEPEGVAPAFGVQFHPESFLSEKKSRLRGTWLAIVETWAQAQAQNQTSANAPLSTPS